MNQLEVLGLVCCNDGPRVLVLVELGVVQLLHCDFEAAVDVEHLGCFLDAALDDDHSVFELVGFDAVEKHLSAKLGVNSAVPRALLEIDARMHQPFMLFFVLVLLIGVLGVIFVLFTIVLDMLFGATHVMVVVEHSHQTASGDVGVVASFVLDFGAFVSIVIDVSVRLEQLRVEEGLEQ